MNFADPSTVNMNYTVVQGTILTGGGLTINGTLMFGDILDLVDGNTYDPFFVAGVNAYGNSSPVLNSSFLSWQLDFGVVNANTVNVGGVRIDSGYSSIGANGTGFYFRVDSGELGAVYGGILSTTQINLDWCSLLDSTGRESLLWSSRVARDTDNYDSIRWQDRQLVSNCYGSEAVALDWENYRLINPLSDMLLDWRIGVVIDDNGTVSLDWGRRKIFNGEGDPIVDWGIDFNLPPQNSPTPERGNSAGSLATTMQSGSAALWFHDGTAWRKVNLQ